MICPICQRRTKKLEYTIWYKPQTGKLCCKKCYKENEEESLIRMAKLISDVSWADLEDWGLIPKFKGKVEMR